MFYQFLKIALRNIKRDWSYFLVITLCLAAGLSINAVMTVQEDRYYQTRYPGSDRTYSTELAVPDSIKEKQKAAASDFGAFMQAYNNKLFQKSVHRRLEPHVPIIPGGAGTNIDSFIRFVQTFLVLPLAVIHACRSVAASVH